MGVGMAETVTGEEMGVGMAETVRGRDGCRDG